MKTYNFSKHNSIYNHYLSELRDEKIQKDSMRFRRNLERLGEISAYEISKTLDYSERKIKTSLGTSTTDLINDKIVLATILRAGLPLHNGLLNFFDRSENCFISAYRKHKSKKNFSIEIEYLSSPDLNGKTVILSDPMLATGNSMVLAYEALLNRGIPNKIHVVSIVSSKVGYELLKKKFPKNTDFWVGSIDMKLNDDFYIVPGLGDAGDLAFGSKLNL